MLRCLQPTRKNTKWEIVDLTAISMPALLTHFTDKLTKKEKNSKKKTQITKKWWHAFAEHIFAAFVKSIREMRTICLELR